MTQQKLQQAVDDIKDNREDIIDRMVEFSKSDALLYWDTRDDLARRQEQVWGPILNWAHNEINIKCNTTNTLETPKQSKYSIDNFRRFLESLSDKELAAFYLTAMNTRSQLLAAAFIKGRTNAEQTFEAANLEELWQADRWGKEEAAENRRKGLLKELREVESFLRQ